MSTRTRTPSDPRYGSRRWKRQRLAVLNRDNWHCRVVDGCTRRARVADHIIPVYPGMPDSLFYGLSNLRASCTYHNNARGSATYAERALRDTGEAEPYRPRDPFASGPSLFSRGPKPKPRI